MTAQSDDITIQVFDSCPAAGEGRILLTVNPDGPNKGSKFKIKFLADWLGKQRSGEEEITSSLTNRLTIFILQEL